MRGIAATAGREKGQSVEKGKGPVVKIEKEQVVGREGINLLLF